MVEYIVPDYLKPEISYPITYINNWLTEGYQKILFEALLNINWEKRTDAPRYEYWTNILNKSYTYGRGKGRRTYYSQEEPKQVGWVKASLMEELGFEYEGCFLNRYDNGKDSLGWHADDDEGIDHNFPIAIVTLGNARELQWKRQDDKLVGRHIQGSLLKPGSLCIMAAGMQQKYFHRIPKAGYEVGPRISLTFRKLKKEV